MTLFPRQEEMLKNNRSFVYKNQKIADATGKSERFLQVYREYMLSSKILPEKDYILKL